MLLCAQGGDFDIMNREEYEKKLFKEILSSMERHGVLAIAESVILTGSFGRGEATYIYIGEEVILKSDVEIAIVCKRLTKRIRRLIAKVSDEFEEDLTLIPIYKSRIEKMYNFNGSILSPKKKTLFTYDLYKGSRTIWGRDFIGGIQISVSEIDLYEAKRIVANRIGELIYIAHTKPQNEPVWKAKLYLAIATAYLLLNGQYESSYKAQKALIMSDKNRINETLGTNFLEQYNQAFSFLRENGGEVEFSHEELRVYTERIYSMMDNLHSPKVNSLSRRVKYGSKYLKCGMPQGLNNFEDKILSGLIKGYIHRNAKLVELADLWHKVLY